MSLSSLLLSAALSAAPVDTTPAARLDFDLQGEVAAQLARHPGQTAAFTLERGELSMNARAWVSRKARATLNVQYFIWTPDNVGRLAMASLLTAANRGVKVRVLVDDFMLEMPGEWLAALDGHPNLDIRVYNPNVHVGFWRKTRNGVAHFRDVNQRMHNKALIVDGLLAVTGGRNLADEYYDFDPEFDFRDRDIFVAGPAAGEMKKAFDAYWDSPLCKPVSALTSASPEARQAALRDSMLAYAADTVNFPAQMRRGIEDIPKGFEALLKDIAWGKATFVTDTAGKNDGGHGLAGGGVTTHFLAELLRSARKRVTIQTPYLIPDDTTLGLFRELTARGVEVRISTNSMANNDNLQAVSGYTRRRKALLAAGVKVFEFKPEPGIQPKLQERYAKIAAKKPIFVVHAKTLVVDGEKVFIGTFNLDPRSMNLNTESGILFEHAGTAREVEEAIERDMSPENSWDASKETGDSHSPFSRRFKTWLWRLLPIEPIL